MWHVVFVVLLAAAAVCVDAAAVVKRSVIKNESSTLTEFTVKMTGYSPVQDDDYVSVAVRAEPGYIVKFEPSAEADRIHHILLYGCTVPAHQQPFWSGAETCSGPSHILYAWARNAPSLELPENVAFPIGNEGDAVQYLVMQVHYAHPFNGTVLDYSGVTLHLSSIRPKYIAQVYLFVSGEDIQPGREAYYTNISCFYNGHSTLYPFAFRTHTHQMGRVVSAVIKHDDKYTLIGKRNPQWPQLFQKIERPVAIQPKDFLAATCRFDSTDKKEPVHMGSMGVNEMCNFYMMFYHDASEPDPFPNGAVCGFNMRPDWLENEYPAEGTSLLPSHPEWEHAAHQSGKPFGVIERGVTNHIGNHALGQVAGLSIDSSGNLYIFHRGSRVWDGATFDQNNRMRELSLIPEETIIVAKKTSDGLQLVRALGRNLFSLPHGIHVDDSNYIYTTDVGTHQVIKWEVKGDHLAAVWTLGERFTPGSDTQHFCKPAGVAVSKQDGSVFVADGYCNNRIMHFSKSGAYLGSFGKASDSASRGVSLQPLGTFFLPHDVAIDDVHGRIFVADRENARVQEFDLEGKPVNEIRDAERFGNVYALDFTPMHGLVFIPGLPTEGVPRIEAFGTPAGARTFQYSFQPSSGEFQRPHAIKIHGNDVFVGEVGSSGGILWHFEFLQDGMTAEASTGVDLVGRSSGGSSFMVFLIVAFAVVMGLFYFLRQHRVNVNSRTPHSLLDRAGFKPLRTNDFESEDSDDDLNISAARAQQAYK